MKNIFKISLCLLITFLVSCSSDSEGTPSINDITLTTTVAQLVNGTTITSGGQSSTNINFYQLGICYNTSPNPTIMNNVVNGTLLNNKEFGTSFEATQFGITYYIKAYILNTSTNEVKYGNEVSINIPLSLSTGIVKGISANGFNVDITIGNNLSSNTERGICYGTGNNPEIDDFGVRVIQNGSNGSGTFNMVVEDYSDVAPNTNYFLRPFVKIGQNYFYGNQVTFKSAGYIGGSGGYIYYDKGETTNGWRYLEAYANSIDNSSFRWGCNNTTFISGISNDIGSGLTNSQAIKTSCNFNNVGAAVALDKTYNGQAAGTWFIPSIDELKQLYKLKVLNIINFGNTQTIMSSSQASDANAFGVSWANSNAGSQILLIKNSVSYTAWPIRRF